MLVEHPPPVKKAILGVVLAHPGAGASILTEILLVAAGESDQGSGGWRG